MILLQISSYGRNGPPPGLTPYVPMPTVLAVIFIIFIAVVTIVVYRQTNKEKKMGLSSRALKRKELKAKKKLNK